MNIRQIGDLTQDRYEADNKHTKYEDGTYQLWKLHRFHYDQSDYGRNASTDENSPPKSDYGWHRNIMLRFYLNRR